jgi:adenine-specific DNA glycosylase
MVAEFLLKRTTSKAAAHVYSDLITKYPDINSLADAKKGDIQRQVKYIGLVNQRAEGILKAANCVKKRYNGELPASYEQLLEIPLVGQYTAGCILSFGMNIPTHVVDSNVQRVLLRVFTNRLGVDPANRAVLEVARSLLPQKEHVKYNYAMIDFGSLVCTYRNCCGNGCPLKNHCDTYLTSSG